jgi:hypothetical protein
MNNTRAILAGLLALAGLAHGWTSPGTGLVCTPDVLVAQSGGALTGAWPDYTQHQALTIADADELRLPAGTRWTVAADVELRVLGLCTALGTPWEPIVLRSASGAPDSWSGLVLDGADPASHLRCVTLSHGDDGLNCLGSSPLVEACTLSGNLSSGLSCFLGGNPVLRHCLIEGNRRYGVEVTGGSSPVLEHCVIRGNNTEASSPRNAVSVGIQGSNNPVLRFCRLEGLGPANPASGFSHWMAGNPLLEDCEITGFRSGVVIQGAGAQGRLERVWIHSSRYSNPNLGGSGVNVNTSATPVFRGCCIEDNDWGVTLTSACAPDFGSAADLGNNRLHDNGNGGSVWDFYHNSSGTIQARGNWWGTTDAATVELHIHDSADGAFGDVQTDPLRADSLFAPFLSPDTGLFALLEGDTLTLEPASRFRALPGTAYSLEGPGTAWTEGSTLRWLPPAGMDSLFTLALRATPPAGPEAVDTLRVWLRRAGFAAPQLACRMQGADLLLEWTAVAGATSYRLERCAHPAFPAEQVVVLFEGSERVFTDAGVLSPGQAWYRVVSLQ